MRCKDAGTDHDVRASSHNGWLNRHATSPTASCLQAGREPRELQEPLGLQERPARQVSEHGSRESSSWQGGNVSPGKCHVVGIAAFVFSLILAFLTSDMHTF